MRPLLFLAATAIPLTTLGRTIAQLRHGFDNTTLITSNYYNTAGHLIHTEQWVASLAGATLHSAQLYTYNELGELLLTCQDINPNGAIDLAGPDRITGSNARYVKLAGDWWHETSSLIYPENDSAAIITNSITRRRLTGLGGSDIQHPTFDIQGATLTAETHSIDHLGNTSISRTLTDRANKTTYHLTTTPASTHDSCSQTVNGLLVQTTSSSGHTTSYAYDGLGRQIASQDARGAVHTRAYDQYGRIAYETDPANNTTSYAYDAFGRAIATTNALGQVTHYAYDIEGRTIATWGNTYPVAYQYDAMGRMIIMRTFRDENGLGDETRWYYHAPTGLLTNKLYADGKGTTYTYTPDGKLASRIWARGITTTYSYDTAHNLASISYSDNTPDVSFGYDRFGRQISAIVDGVSTNLYSYDALTQALAVETQNGVEISRTYDVLGRPVSLSLGIDYAIEYGYDTYGRFNSVESQSVDNFSYSYLPNTDLLSGYASGDFSRTVAYESARSLITSVANTFGSTTISQYDYTNDALGRRTAISRSGTAFDDTPVTDAYGYNHRSEVTSARRSLASNPSQEVRGFSYDYEYDPIGNRISSTEYDHNNNPLVSAYTANALNQYEQRTVPGYAAVRGSATNSATVTVNGNLTWRLDDYFYGGDTADNSSSAIMKELQIIAAQSNHYASVTGHVFVAQTPEQYQYDEDGNLLSDDRFTYTWDAENRLISVTTRDDLPVSIPRVRVTHYYDHQSRRIATATAVWTNSIWQPTESRTFTYDGWNEIAETISDNQSITTTNLYVWGLDLSGSRQGAGGIGGLLAASFSGATTALYTYDANGNIGQLIAPIMGDILSHYEYDPFGKTIVSSGLLAQPNPFRFSTKWFDNDTGLGYWGYRWYSPEMGRWLNRDPSGEDGGLNVYAFVANSILNRIDLYGLVAAALSTSPSFSMGKCGNFSVVSSFSLMDAGTLTSGGTIIQNMSIDIHVWDCATGKDVSESFVGSNNNNKYVEAFTLGVADTWTLAVKDQSTCGTRGKGTWEGIAQYYDSYVASHINDPWGIPWYYSTPSHPQPWGAFLGMLGWITATPDSPSAIGYRRTLRVEWDCCDRDKDTTYSYVGGSTTSLTP